MLNYRRNEDNLTELDSAAETKRGLVETTIPKGSVRRGLFYIATTLSGLWFVADQVVEHVTSQVSGQIDQTGNELSTKIDASISPTTEDIDKYLGKIDGFFEDYSQLRIDICTSALGTQMEGCVDVLAEAESQVSQTDEITSPATTMPE